jgi:hypothetical protein
MDTETPTAPLPPAAEDALLRLERALAAPTGDDGRTPADRLAHAEASYVRVGRVA